MRFLKSAFRKVINGALSPLGLELIPKGSLSSPDVVLPVELDAYEREVIEYVLEERLSMCKSLALVNTVKACRYVVENQISGDFVECGVWRGGNAILAAKIFEYLGADRRVWLFDTFSGMTEPTIKDVRLFDGEMATTKYFETHQGTHTNWAYSSIDDVRENMRRANVNMSSVTFVEGDVAQTLREESNLPVSISVLRLDTDWFESTLLEMKVLYPRVPKGGVLIVDDYGHWRGSKLAVDEYFEQNASKPLLNVVYNSGTRSAVKI